MRLPLLPEIQQAPKYQPLHSSIKRWSMSDPSLAQTGSGRKSPLTNINRIIQKDKFTRSQQEITRLGVNNFEKVIHYIQLH